MFLIAGAIPVVQGQPGHRESTSVYDTTCHTVLMCFRIVHFLEKTFCCGLESLQRQDKSHEQAVRILSRWPQRQYAKSRFVTDASLLLPSKHALWPDLLLQQHIQHLSLQCAQPGQASAALACPGCSQELEEPGGFLALVKCVVICFWWGWQ